MVIVIDQSLTEVALVSTSAASLVNASADYLTTLGGDSNCVVLTRANCVPDSAFAIHSLPPENGLLYLETSRLNAVEKLLCWLEFPSLLARLYRLIVKAGSLTQISVHDIK